MHDLQCIRRLGPGPQSFTRRQHHQQKPDGSCLTFKQHNRTGGQPLGNIAGDASQQLIEQHIQAAGGSSQQLIEQHSPCDKFQH